ncbi:hypothetical protein [Rhizobium sp. 60-20]|uniref:hypothetical protein n=1 Tax=Rhizobium sp. 60-20 TaxID=1895819 RepID=UPI000929D3C0|nr:hypothetical protein [Rhizobium sp. 60-20]OJY66409.1 MAG: hypothetical protein BGP09_31250 [Rhizobium sp. 60-20]
MTTCQFNFDEVKMPGYGEGVLLYGTATLESDCEDDSYFYVASIQIGNRVLTRPSRINSAHVVDDFFFTEIANQIESDKTAVGRNAADAWTDAVAGNVEPVPALRRRAGMPLGFVPEISPTRPYVMEAAE